MHQVSEGALQMDPPTLWPPNGKMIEVQVTGSASDLGSSLAAASFEVIDEYGESEPSIPDKTYDGEEQGSWVFTIELPASRKGNDKDGRQFIIRVVVSDRAGNVARAEDVVLVPHDQR
jgi:hypothetical protein